MLEVKRLVCSKNDRALFRPVSFFLEEGMILQVTGINGSGKTTLLRTIAGLIEQTSGNVELNNQTIVYIGHKLGLHPDLTIEQNLQFMQLLSGQVTNAGLNTALDFFGMNAARKIKCAELSAGQVQRVGLMSLLLHPAKIWILDEPTANLDHHATELLITLMLQHLQNAGLIILATHQQLNIPGKVMQVLHLENYH